MLQSTSKSIIAKASTCGKTFPSCLRCLSTSSSGASSSSSTTTEQVTIDPALQALYAQLPRGEFWDRQPEDLRLMYGSDKESIYKLGKHRSNALELVHRIPVVEVDGDMAICDGGGGGLGHPLEYIALDVPNSINYCKYCSLRYTKSKNSKSSAH